MKTTKSILTSDLETNAQRNLSKSLKMKNQFLLALIDCLIGSHWLRSCREKSFACMVESALLWTPSKISRISKGLWRLCTKFRTRNLKSSWTYFGRIQLSQTANWASTQITFEIPLKLEILWSLGPIECWISLKRTTWTWSSELMNASWTALRGLQEEPWLPYSQPPTTAENIKTQVPSSSSKQTTRSSPNWSIHRTPTRTTGLKTMRHWRRDLQLRLAGKTRKTIDLHYRFL